MGLGGQDFRIYKFRSMRVDAECNGARLAVSDDDRITRVGAWIYRHVVRPGITGWAQVMQGYAGDADETRIKIQHDFYYIKHFSFWLDILIVFKTVRILLTGWGSR